MTLTLLDFDYFCSNERNLNWNHSIRRAPHSADADAGDGGATKKSDGRAEGEGAGLVGIGLIWSQPKM